MEEDSGRMARQAMESTDVKMGKKGLAEPLSVGAMPGGQHGVFSSVGSVHHINVS
jgi:hypothetical protein